MSVVLDAWAAGAGMTVAPFTAVDVQTTARLWKHTRQAGLSLGGRAGLALASRVDTMALTTDRAWADLRCGISIQVLR